MNKIQGLFSREPVKVFCNKHGEVNSFRVMLPSGREVNAVCPECVKERDAEAKEAEKRRGDELRAAAIIERRKNSIYEAGVMPRFADKGLDSYLPSDPAQAAAKLIAEQYISEIEIKAKDGMGLIFSGGVGVGKTHLSSAILVAALDCGHSVRYMTCQDMISAIRDTWRKTSEESETQVIRKLSREIDFMVIDEVGVQRGTDEEKNLMFRIMDSRYGHRKPVIILTNLDAAGLKEFLGERIYDRLRECCKWVSINSKSHRAKKKQAEAGN